ncbi:ribbon-helix-helix protein, CopG family [Neomoorella carbonis]|uniref:ribbon-helix-helix protein, CopG family n=1 Tax=Neomoorella carbonis TaxID=3062783 RepID=UPI003253DD23
MIRTQIQLTEEQYHALKKMAAVKKISMAELIRLGVDQVLAGSNRDQKERIQRAIKAAGRFRSGVKDLSRNHDAYLTGAFAE